MKITRKEGWKMSWESLDNHGHLMIKRDPLIYTYRKEEWWLGVICYTIWGCLNEASFVAHLSYRHGKEEHTEAIDRPHWGWKMEFLWLWLIMMLTNKTRSYHALQDFARGRFYANSITRPVSTYPVPPYHIRWQNLSIRMLIAEEIKCHIAFDFKPIAI